MSSVTITKVVKELGRNSYGYEIDVELKANILEKIGYSPRSLAHNKIEIKEIEDVRRLWSFLYRKVARAKNQFVFLVVPSAISLELAPNGFVISGASAIFAGP